MHHAAGMLLALACALLHGAAGSRLASACDLRGPARLVAAVVIATATAVLASLALGLVALGSSRPALASAALLTFLLVRRAAPAPPVPLTAELLAVLASRRSAAVGGVLAGLAAVSAAWSVYLPHPMLDSLTHHLSQPVRWVDDGRPGSVHDLLYWQAFVSPSSDPYPVGAFPLTHEVVLSWWLSLSRGFVLPFVWGTVLLSLVALAGWVGARALGAPRLVAGLTSAAVTTVPHALLQAGSAKNDLAAYAFFLCGAALLALAWNRPAALWPAVLAMGVSVGVKSTGLVLGTALVAACAWRHRRVVRERRGVAAAVVAGSLVVGGTWYLRNAWSHGSPFWPLISVPWGTPPAEALETAGRFVDDPARNVTDLGTAYLSSLSGGTVLLVAALLSPLVVRRRLAVALSAAAALSFAQWATADFSGLSDYPGLRTAYVSMVLETTRYLLPGAGLAALGLAALSARRGRAPAVVLLTLAATVVWNVVTVVGHDGAMRPPLPWLAAGAAGGLLAGLAVATLVARTGTERARPVALPAAAMALGAAVLGAAPLADGLWSRHARTDWFGSGEMVRWLGGQAPFADGTAVVAASPLSVAFLAGDRAQHVVVLLPVDEACADVRARTRAQWVVLLDGGAAGTAGRCLDGRRPDFESDRWTVYAPQVGAVAAPDPVEGAPAGAGAAP